MIRNPQCHPHRRLIALLLACAPAVAADQVVFAEGGKLSGDVLSIQEDGAIRIQSALAAQPLSLVGNAVRQIEFKASEALPGTGNSRFTLPGEDFVMGTLLSYSREGGVKIQADGIGEILLPVGSLRTMALDTEPVRTIYRGPDELANWTTDGRRGGQNWEFARKRLSAKGNGQIGRMLDLPERYVLRMSVRWQGHPNFQVGFSDPLEEPQVRVDRYYLQFGRAGLEIKREAKEGKRYHTVGMLNRTPDQFPNREMEIELRVDARESMIHLAINGKPEGRFMDPFGSPPFRGGISLVNNAGPGQQLDVNSLTVESWHETGILPTAPREKVANTADTILMRDGDSFGGVLESVKPTDEGLLFRMKVGFREQPIEVLGEDVAMVTFATTEVDASAAELESGFVLQLRDRGRLSVIRSQFDSGQVRAVHPLLGELNILRTAVSSLERKLPDRVPDSP